MAPYNAPHTDALSGGVLKKKLIINNLSRCAGLLRWFCVDSEVAEEILQNAVDKVARFTRIRLLD